MSAYRFMAMMTITLLSAAAVQAGEDAKKPNILFIIFDDWGWQHAGAYGCRWVQTPNFAEIKRGNSRMTQT